MASVYSSAEDLISRVDEASTETRSLILREIFNSGRKFQDLANEREVSLEKSQQDLSEALVIIRELRAEVKIHQASAIEALQASAVVNYKLLEAEKLLNNLKSENPETSPIPRSEIYRIDEKFTGKDRALYPAFQRQIKIALARNADRYTSLQ